MQISNLLFKTFFPGKQYKCQAKKKGIKIKVTDASGNDVMDAKREGRKGVGLPALGGTAGVPAGQHLGTPFERGHLPKTHPEGKDRPKDEQQKHSGAPSSSLRCSPAWLLHVN